LVYLDNAATTQKPIQVIDAIVKYYKNFNANVHRGVYTLAEEATAEYEESRKLVANFINAKSYEEIIFVRNSTEALNLIAYAWGRKNVKENDRILITRWSTTAILFLGKFWQKKKMQNLNTSV